MDDIKVQNVENQTISGSMCVQPLRLLIVGAGLTGAMTTALIKHNFPTEVKIDVWEKSLGAGGRMKTHRAPDGKSSVDLGAQYVTRTSQYAKKHERLYEELLQAGILKPFPGKIEGESVSDDQLENFMAPHGMNSVVKHFFSSSGARPRFQTLCSNISLSREQRSTTAWRATPNDGPSEEFHAIILTIPVPQILQLNGTIQDCLQEHVTSLQQVQYSSRYALALCFPENTRFEFPWTAKYVQGHPCIRYVAVDSAKRGKDSANPEASILVHTGVPFGLKYLETDIKEVENIIFGHFNELFPGLPRPSSTRCIRWRYSQVHKPFPGQPGALVPRDRPLLVLAGDAFVHSNFSGCVESSLVAVEKLREHMRTSVSITE